MSPRVQIVGSYLSPYVRKVLACLNLKGLDYEIDPIVPFMGDDRFTALSPLRRIPVLIDDRVTLADSSVICQYLEDGIRSLRSIRRTSPSGRVRAGLEEHADTRIGARLQPFEALMLRTPIRDHRDALRAAGAPLTASTLGTGTPRRGVLRT